MPTLGEPTTMIGRRIGSYEIVAKLGEGGMGEVYRGWESTRGSTVFAPTPA